MDSSVYSSFPVRPATGWLAFLLTCCGLAAAEPASAQAVVGEIEFRFELVSGCALSQGGAGAPREDEGVALLDFGTPIDLTRPADGITASGPAAGGLTIECSSSLIGPNAPSISLSGGEHRRGPQRRMATPDGDFAPYGLFRDPARTDPYDPDIPVQIDIPSAGIAVPILIYGRVPHPEGLADGTYTDVITVTLEY